jgi:REP-associated tyrosine transposase
LWARGYFVAISGDVTDEAIADLIQLQRVEPADGDSFRITE